MIRQLIIPGIVAVAAHAFVLFTPPEKPPASLPPAEALERVIIDLGKLPEIPPTRDPDADKPAVDVRNMKLPPLVPDTIIPDAASPFVTPFQPTLPTPDFTGEATMKIPVGDYTNRGLRDADGKEVAFRLADLDNRPRTLFQPAPDYPHALKNQGVNGEVVVNFTVDENGNVQDVRAVRSSHQEFEMPTIRAVSKWRFEPGRKDGKRVRFRMSVPVAFTLNEDA